VEDVQAPEISDISEISESLSLRFPLSSGEAQGNGTGKTRT
jgi:hypothetical protein